MTKVQAEALAAFVARIRPEWRPAGILAALEKAAPTADVHDVACALIRLAEDGTVRTPGLLPQPGPHWAKPNGEHAPRRGDHTMRCPEHPTQPMPCVECRQDRAPMPDGFMTQAAAAIEAGRTRLTTHDYDQEDQ